MIKFILDTNIFNRFLDDNFNIENLNDNYKFYASYIQFDELANTRDQSRRAELLSIFHKVNPEEVPTESVVLPFRLGKSKFSSDGTYKKLRDKLDELASSLPRKKKKQKPNSNPKDALIGEIAIKNKFILITTDTQLLIAVQNMGSVAITYDEFKRQYFVSNYINNYCCIS